MVMETISVEELFLEELDALEHQRQQLSGLKTPQAKRAVKELGVVIKYFKARLDHEDGGESMGISVGNKTIH